MTAYQRSHYRADIDGLRALAVVPVVLFHAGFPGFRGGYVGVDVFFVISGYLITGILAAEASQGRFSLAAFYRRRVLRIFPALFMMLAVVSVVAYATMLPGELVDYAKSVLATLGFVSNLYFHASAGYFAASSHSLPLLHTWSLAVEEQFYIVWPLLIALLAHSRRAIQWLGWGLAAASCVLCVFWLRADPAGAFYLIPTRAWELLLGGMLVFAPRVELRHRLVRELVPGAGLLLLLGAIVGYDERTPFPGLAALVPCAGAALIIASGTGQPAMVTRLLSLRPAVFVGKISYSLYLWHWPVIVFAQLGLNLEIGPVVKVGEVLAAGLLAVLSWKYVETPFRHVGQGLPSPVFLTRAAALMASFGVAALGVLAASGFPGRYTAREQAIAAYTRYEQASAYRVGTCFMVDAQSRYDEARCLSRSGARPSILLLGDSHAAHLWPGLQAHAGQYDVMQANRTGCRPMLGGLGDPGCTRFMERMLDEWVPAHPVDMLLLAGRWNKADMPALRRSLAALQGRARRIVLVGPIPQYTAALPRLLVKASTRHDPAVVSRALLSEPFELDGVMRSMSAQAGVDYVSLTDLLCRQGVCRTQAQGDIPLQFDQGHLTAEGSKVVVDALLTQEHLHHD